MDGVPTIDPRNTATSESNNNVWSLFYVPGSAFMDTQDVPHGAVAEVTYYSTALGRSGGCTSTRRRATRRRPTSTRSSICCTAPATATTRGPRSGRAGFILDNLIAQEGAKPMIVVMPAGHTARGAGTGRPDATDAFVSDFITDVVPYVEKHYRVLTERENTAIAGLSMALADDHISQQAKRGLDLFWFSTGKDDFLLQTTRTVAMFKKYGFDVVYEEIEGGHTWINWRDISRSSRRNYSADLVGGRSKRYAVAIRRLLPFIAQRKPALASA